MAQDIQTLLSIDQAVTATAVSTDIFQINPDQGVNLGVSGIPFFARVTENFTALTSLKIQLIGANQSNLSDKFVIEESGDITLAELKKGFVWKGRINHHKPCKYLAFNYVVTGSNAIAGKITAALALYNEFHAGSYQSSGKVTITGN